MCSCMALVTRHGVPSRATTLPLWHRRSQVNVLFPPPESPSASSKTGSIATSLRHFRASNHSFTEISFGGSFLLWQKKRLCSMTLMNIPLTAKRSTQGMLSRVQMLLISDVVRLSGTYLILLIRIRLYLYRLDYIFYCTYHLGYPYCPSLLGCLIVLSLLFPLGTFLLFPMDYCLV